jgi:hypothetical protein
VIAGIDDGLALANGTGLDAWLFLDDRRVIEARP